MKDLIGMPEQCIATGKSFVEAHGEKRAIEVIQSNIDSLAQTCDILKDNDGPIRLRLKIAVQCDFWSQTLQSIQPPVK